MSGAPGQIGKSVGDMYIIYIIPNFIGRKLRSVSACSYNCTITSKRGLEEPTVPSLEIPTTPSIYGKSAATTSDDYCWLKIAAQLVVTRSSFE